MTNRGLAWLTGGLVAFGMAGCGSPTPPPAATTPSSAAPVSRLPARPLELKLDGLEACSLLTDAQRTQLGVYEGSPGNADQFGSSDCQWTNNGGPPDVSYLDRLVTKQGADYALDSTTGAQVVAVDGFPAVQTLPSGDDPKHNCVVLVDVARGQSLWTQFNNSFGDYPKINHDLACQKARDFTSMVLGNLRARVK